MKQYFNMIDCLFCKIVKKELKVNIHFENSDILAFDDINPQAPLHILVIPKIHLATLNDLKEKAFPTRWEFDFYCIHACKEV